MSIPDVLATEYLATACGRRLALATLDSEKSLNALTLPMVDALQRALDAWAVDDSVVAVLLRGRGERAFCAGGDVRKLTEAARAGTPDAGPAAAFFGNEYRLDHTIHRYRKPLLVWGSGVVMGGGMGLFAGARHRLVTETSRLAMPEITIGLYPDVGGSHFLSRLPGRLGLFLGLTGVSFGAADALHLGFATQALPASAWPRLLAGLAASRWDGADPSDAVLAGLALRDLEPGPLQRLAEDIEQLTAGADLAEIDRAWRAELPTDDWLARAVSNYRKGSPTSAALIWKQWRESGTRSLAEVFRTEWTVSTQCVLHPDFPEGVRALLIDKDQSPRWQPATLAEVGAAWVDGHYALPAGMAHPLADLTD